MTKHNQVKHSLFARILIRLTIPLFLLATIVSAVQLVNQIQSLNQYFQVESHLIFVSVQRALDKILENPNSTEHPETILPAIERSISLKSSHVSLTIYDLYSHSALLFDNKKAWTEIDTRRAENSIYLKKKEGRNYFVQIDKDQKSLIAYMPHDTTDQSHTYVTRIIYPLGGIEEALKKSKGTLVSMIALIFLTGLLIGRGLAKSIITPIHELNHATQAIMSGKLGKKVSIKTGDELEALADAFNHMSDALKVMKESAEDTNPLTHLPGNNGIKYELQRRILQKQKFVLFHSDLDRFKVFNDMYGLAKGDLAITKTAELLLDVLQTEGEKDDFIGHQGGDDFVVIVKPNRAPHIGETIVKRFDNEIVKSLYSKEDFDRGYVETLDRRGAAEQGTSEAVVKKFPLLGFSLAGISNTKRDFVDYNAILKEAVKVKKEVKNKNLNKSSYLIVE